MKYVSVDNLQAYCDNQIDHSITPNDFQRMNHIDIPEDIGDFSDGYHTFNDLYYQRLVLFAVIVNANKNKAWKTKYHEDGEPCFGGGWFLVTIETPEGEYGYHYEEKYWNMFDCKELQKAKHWDGYTDKDVGRLLSLTQSDRGDNKMNAKEWETELLHRYNEANGDYQDYVCLTLDETKEIMMLLKDLARMRIHID